MTYPQTILGFDHAALTRSATALTTVPRLYLDGSRHRSIATALMAMSSQSPFPLRTSQQFTSPTPRNHWPYLDAHMGHRMSTGSGVYSYLPP